jgi:hypothetical protein
MLVKIVEEDANVSGCRRENPRFSLSSDGWESTVSLEDARRAGPVALFFYLVD